jgi:antitoxin Phd
MDWQVADAKNRFSEMMNRAMSEGPQRVRRRQDAFIFLTESEFERRIGARPDFKQYLMSGPGFDELDLTRDPSPMRDVEL